MDPPGASIRQRALDEGFDLVGIAAAGEASGASHLRRWIDAGRHGDMAWMARTAALREDPRRVLPGCRSVVAVAMSYRTGHRCPRAMTVLLTAGSGSRATRGAATTTGC